MECRIRFHDKSFQHFDWCKLEKGSGTVSDSGTSSADELKTICLEAEKIIVFLAQQNILLASPELPSGANKQQLNAIAYAVEEQLAEDIENCFFAVAAQQADHSVPVAVINREIMNDCVELLASHHVNASLILPEGYLCPWSDEDDFLAGICPVPNGYLIRYGQHKALFCHTPILSQLLTLLSQQKSSNQSRLNLYADDIDPEFELEGLSINRLGAINLLSQPVDLQLCVNLKQKEFKSTYQWFELLKHWQWPAVAMILLGLVFFASNLLDLWEKDKTYNALINQQKSLLKEYLPNVATSGQPKKQLIQVLAENSSGPGQAGFVDLLHEYSRLKSGFDSIDTNKILYQQSSLVINLESKNLESLESFRTKLEQSRFAVEIENININPDKTTGRLVMREQ